MPVCKVRNCTRECLGQICGPHAVALANGETLTFEDGSWLTFLPTVDLTQGALENAVAAFLGQKTKARAFWPTGKARTARGAVIQVRAEEQARARRRRRAGNHPSPCPMNW